MLRVMRDAGLDVATPFGFVEITPEREYMLVTSFVPGAHEILDGEVDDDIIDQSLRTVRHAVGGRYRSQGHQAVQHPRSQGKGVSHRRGVR